MASGVVEIACAVFALGSMACGSTRDADGGGLSASPGAQVDTTDPVMVAEAFYDAVDRQDMEAALVWILPEQQVEVRQAFEIDGMPDLPPGYEVFVEVRDDIAEASIPTTNIKVAMIFDDGRWWVCD